MQRRPSQEAEVPPAGQGPSLRQQGFAVLPGQAGQVGGGGDPPHAVLHIAWGIAGLLILFSLPTNRIWLTLGLIFGVFYTLLGFLGIIVHNPFSLRLAWEENTFHLTVGPLMLVLAFLAWRAERNMPEPAVKPTTN